MTGQLTYAIADGARGARQGGWGVVEIGGALSEDAQDLLVRGRTVSLPQRVTPFVSNAELASRAARWRVVPFGNGSSPSVLAWHSVEAGSDSTGRPGNVFTHAAQLDLTPPARPMDWAFSPDWLRPYGVTEVSEARLPETVRLPAVQLPFMAWLHGDTAMAQNTVESAVARAMPAIVEHRQVVLVVPDHRDAAGLLDFLAWLLPFGRSAMTRWACYEDAASAVDLVDRGFDIMTVERSEHAPRTSADGRGLVVVDCTESAEGDDRWLEVVRAMSGRDPGSLRELLVDRDHRPDAERDPLGALRRMVGLEPDLPPEPFFVHQQHSASEPVVARSAGGVETRRGAPTPELPGVGGVDLLKDPPSVSEPFELAAATQGSKRGVLRGSPSTTSAQQEAQTEGLAEDALDSYDLPSPGSALAAHRVLAGEGLSYAQLVASREWTAALPAVSPLSGLALAHIAAQDRLVMSSLTQLRAVADGADRVDGFALRMRGPLLLAIGRAELIEPDAAPWHGGDGLDLLRGYVAEFDPDELMPFAFQFSGLRDAIDQMSRPDLGGSGHVLLAHRMDFGATSVWSTVTRSGGTLRDVVLTLLRGLVGYR